MEVFVSMSVVVEALHEEERVRDSESLSFTDSRYRAMQKLVTTFQGLLVANAEGFTQRSEPDRLAAPFRMRLPFLRSFPKPIDYRSIEVLPGLCLYGQGQQSDRCAEKGPEVGLRCMPPSRERNLVLRNAQQEFGTVKLGNAVEEFSNANR